jgi:hypothetical protein
MRCPIDVTTLLALFAATIPLAASAQPGGVSGSEPCDNCAVVVSIAVAEEEESWAPLGVVAAVPSSAGSMQARPMIAFGGDAKREVLTIGAAGGAVYSRRLSQYQKMRWNVTVKMDGGGQRVIPQRYEPFLREGDRVRIHGNQLELVNS